MSDFTSKREKVYFMFRTILLAFVLLFFAISAAVSQDDNENKKKWRFTDNYKPSVEFSYGISGLRLSTSPVELSDAGMFELRLGFTERHANSRKSNIVKYSNRYLSLSNASSDHTGKTQEANSAGNSMWRFGFGNKEGYGISSGSFSLLPYNSISFEWSEFKYESNPDISDTLYGTLNDFNDAFRFGSSAEAGLNFQFFNKLSLTPAYQISDIFPRHLFGKQFMSSIIEFSGLAMIEAFTRQIMKSSGVGGVIMSFLLKSAYEYGFYQLRKDQMNWPFTSTAPLRYNSFKLALSYVF